MGNCKVPAYAVCGADADRRFAFFLQFCKANRPLRVCFDPIAAVAGQLENVCLIGANASLEEAGQQIAQKLADGGFDALWLDWDDDQPIRRLLEILRVTALWQHCRLRKIVRCAEGEAELERLSDPDGHVTAQIAQCDLLAVRESDPKRIRRLRGKLLTYQPNLEVVSLNDRREIASVLAGRNLMEAIRFTLVIVVCVALLAMLGRLHDSIPDSIAVFLGTYLQALPFLLLGILLSSVIQVFVPADLLQRIFPKNLLGGMVFGVLGGFLLPICDCASIPVFRSLIRKGVPLPAAVTFMIAAPIINPVVMLSTYYAFGGNARVMLARMSFGIVCSVLIGLWFAREKGSVLTQTSVPACACCTVHAHGEGGDCHAGHDHAPAHSHAGHDLALEHSHTADDSPAESALLSADTADAEPEQDEASVLGHRHAHAHARTSASSLGDRLVELLAHFRAEFFEVAKFLLIGIGVSTVLQIVMGNNLNTMRYDSLAVSMLVMMAMAFLLSLCSSSDAVVGKNMGASLPMGAVMAFMVFGPMIDIKNLILMSASFTRRFMIKLLIATFAVSFVTVYLAFALGLGAVIA